MPEVAADQAPFEGYVRWYRVTDVAGMRLTMRICTGVHDVVDEADGLVIGKVIPYFFGGTEGECAGKILPEDRVYSLHHPLFVDLNRFVSISDDNDTFCGDWIYETVPGVEYHLAAYGDFVVDAAIDSPFNFSLQTNDRCDGAANLYEQATAVQFAEDDDAPAALAAEQREPVQVEGSTEFASQVEPGSLPACGGDGGDLDVSGKRGVWFRVAGTGGTIVASTCRGSSDTQITAFRGSCGGTGGGEGLRCVGASDDAYSCGRGSILKWTGEVGDTYYLLLTPGQLESAAPGNFKLNVHESARENICTGAAELLPVVATSESTTTTPPPSRSYVITDDGDRYTPCNASGTTHPAGIWFAYKGENKKVREVLTNSKSLITSRLLTLVLPFIESRCLCMRFVVRQLA